MAVIRYCCIEVNEFCCELNYDTGVSKLAGYGIIGLYVSLVFVIGRFVRGFVGGISYRIMYVIFLYELCRFSLSIVDEHCGKCILPHMDARKSKSENYPLWFFKL